MHELSVDERQIACTPEQRVVMANELLRAAQRWSLTEIRLVRLLISQVRMDDDQLYTYTCSVQELSDILGISPEYIYQVADKSTDLIMGTVIKLIDKNDRTGRPNYRKFHWVETCEYNNGKFTFRLAEDLRPYVLGLREMFTTYDMESILRLPTVNAIRLYELLASWATTMTRKQLPPQFVGGRRLDDQREIAFDIDYLREYFDAQDRYRSTGDFVRRIVDPAAAAIQGNTVFPLSTWRLVYRGRAITHVVFRITYDPKVLRDGYHPDYVPVKDRPKPPEATDPDQLRMY